MDEGKILTIATREKGLGKMTASWTETWEAVVLKVREMKTKKAKRTAESNIIFFKVWSRAVSE